MTTDIAGAEAEAALRASVFETLTGDFMMEAALVAACLDGTGPDIPISSRLGIVVIARAHVHLGLPNLVDPKQLQPEEVTSVAGVRDLIVRKIRERA